MYRHVIIQSTVAARMLDERISRLSATRDVDVWRWVQTFHESWRISEVGIPLFLKAVNLTQLETRMILSSETLATLRRSCPSLRVLDVWVDTDSHEALAQVGRFEYVTRLRIRFSQWASSTDTLADVPAWNMPAVTHLWWEDLRNELSHGPSFKSRCRFPRLTYLDFKTHESFNDLEGIAALHMLGRFFDAHRGIRSLRLWVKDVSLLHIVPLVRARYLRIVCSDQGPPRALVPLLRPEVKYLELGLMREHCRPELTTHLWELLTQFTAEDDTPPPALEMLRLVTIDADGIPCDDLMNEEKFLSALRPHVLALNARGIRIFVHDTQICV
jgi:hypothetical protein